MLDEIIPGTHVLVRMHSGGQPARHRTKGHSPSRVWEPLGEALLPGLSADRWPWSRPRRTPGLCISAGGVWGQARSVPSDCVWLVS